MKRNAFGEPRLDIGNESLDRLRPAGGGFLAEERRIDIEEQRRVLISGAPHHHPIDVIELGAHLCERREPAVEYDRYLGKTLFQGTDETVIERWNVAVVLRQIGLSARPFAHGQ